jgi:hypothetical protein
MVWAFAIERRTEPLHTMHIPVCLGRSLTTQISDDGWETVDVEHIACWKTAQSLLSQRQFLHKGSLYGLSVDWKPVIRRLQRHHKIMCEVYTATDNTHLEAAIRKFSKLSVDVVFKLEIFERYEPVVSDYFYDSLVEYFLNDFFLIMNLSHPSSCDLWGAKIGKSRRFPRELRLSNYRFDSIFFDRANHWPGIRSVPLKATLDWFCAIRSDMTLVPQNRMEMALFAIAHICKEDLSVVSIVWIFYALETIFDTKPGENFRIPHSRISILLNANPREQKRLKYNLRDLYDMRSGLVHGGLQVIHPLHNEAIDPHVDKIYDKTISVVEFGFRIIIACLQVIIERQIHDLSFEEIMHEGTER